LLHFKLVLHIVCQHSEVHGGLLGSETDRCHIPHGYLTHTCPTITQIQYIDLVDCSVSKLLMKGTVYKMKTT